MLDTYRLSTKQLLSYPDSPDKLYSDTNLDLWINRARQQLAGESQSIRILGTVSTAIGSRGPYPFSNINVTATTGVASALHVRSILYTVGSGQKWTRPRNWEWFQLYKMNNVVPRDGPPEVWSQYSQGSTGSFYVDPVPDDTYMLTCDCVCLPIDLVTNLTTEVIPPLWQDAVCYFAAYLALLSAQSGQRTNDADRMMQRYEEFVERARRFANPSVNNYLYQQSVDPTIVNKLGLTPKQGAAG